MNPPVLQLQGIEKRFGGVRALRSVDFEISAGEVVGLAGENGAGKSTLMKILGGIYQPDAGRIRIDGEPVIIHTVSEATRHGISFIHQELNVLDNLDIAANVFLGREPLRGGFLRLVDTRWMHEQAGVYLKRLGLEIPTTTLLSCLSIAQQQLVEIAKALSLKARILIMDEPTSSLTISETARLLEVVRELKTQAVAIIYVSHRLSEIEEIADRVVVLRDGENAGELARGDITHERMVKMMIGRDLEKFYQPARKERASHYFEIEGLRTTRYPNQQISFDVGRGEIVGLAGLVGAGRTEVARALFGVEAASAAIVTLDRQVLQIRSPQEAIRQGIYLIPEDRRLAGLITELGIRENVTLPSLKRYARAGVIAMENERAGATDICTRLNVKAPSIEDRVINLSGGNQQKVVLAKWLGLEPKLLIFDEPTRGVDVGAKAEIYALMRQLANGGVAILMISSDMEEVLHISDRVAVMHEGALTGILERSECTEENIMRLAVGKRAA
jgi:ribose transport system ATP-binding protein